MNYTQYYNMYKDKIYSYFYYNLGKDIQAAEDLTSDTFLKWYEKFDSYDDTYNFSTWIFTVARNTLYDYYRKQKIDISLDVEGEIDTSEFLKYEEDFDAHIDNEFKMNHIYDLLDKLPSAQRECIVMKYMQELSTKEISELTGKNEANIRKIISRGLSFLQKSLQSLTV